MKYLFTPKLQKKINKLIQKNKTRAKKLKRKINEIVQQDKNIEHYKNLKSPLQRQKRVHINSHFVLTFEFRKQEKLIIFTDFDHHDKIYKKK